MENLPFSKLIRVSSTVWIARVRSFRPAYPKMTVVYVHKKIKKIQKN